MPVSRIRLGRRTADYIVVDTHHAPSHDTNASDEPPSPRAPYMTRDLADDSDSSDDEDDHPKNSTVTATPTLPGISTPLLVTMTLTPTTTSKSPVGLLADTDPTETVVVSIRPPPPPPYHNSGGGRISQTTEHLLIAAGSIGATIIIVMIVLAFYTMRRRGLSLGDILKQNKDQGARGGSSVSTSTYDWDRKQRLDDDYSSIRKVPVYPPPAVAHTRLGSLSSQSTLQTLDRSDSFKRRELERTSAVNGIPKSFQLDNPPVRMNSHRRDNSATPSSPFLGNEGPRRSASTHNTRSMQDEREEYMQYSNQPQQQPTPTQPTPPSFRQFLSNRPSISQRPGLGGIASRFSWTNSQAPQTPHDPSRDTLGEPLGGRESFMTNRSSVPRFRTINSWVNQQSNRIEERKLKEQYRMTQNSDFLESTAGDDIVPEMPPMPRDYKQSSGLAGKNIKHQRHETSTSVNTAPIFKQHPGTEVRFSTRSTVPSEILDMGRHNSVLR